MIGGLVRKTFDKGVGVALGVDPPFLGFVRDGLADAVELGASVRGSRAFHPRGVMFRGDFQVSGDRPVGAPFLDQPGRYDALVRLSKAASTPAGIPDALGLAVRVHDAAGPGAPFDLLLATTGRTPVLRHALAPRSNYSAVYTSIAPYRVGGRRRFFAALPTQPGRRVPTSRTGARAAVANEALSFRIALATAGGAWHPIAWLTLSRPVDPATDICFDVIGNALPDVRPAGWIQRARGPAYRASQEGSGRCPLGFG